MTLLIPTPQKDTTLEAQVSQLARVSEYSHDVVIYQLPQKAQPFSRPLGTKAITLAVLAALAINAVPLVCFLSSQVESSKESPTTSRLVPVKSAVSALGRLSPQGEAIKLSAPASLQNARVEQLFVEKEGDQVVQGQVVAILDNRNCLAAAVEQAQKQVKVAQANLAKVKAGAKAGEIEAQKAEIARLRAQLLREKTAGEATVARYQAQLHGDIGANSAAIARYQAQLNNSASEFRRYQHLYHEGALSASALDSKRMSWETAQAQVNEAKANLNRMQGTGQAQIDEAKANQKRTVETLQEQINSAKANLDRIQEVRPTDLQEAQAQVEQAIASLKHAEAELDLAYVKSPFTGRVLKIHTHPGETASKDGILEVGKTAQMYVIAEVYQSDIGKVQLGQKATITSSTIGRQLLGTVVEKGWKIAKKDVLNTDPASDVDARVVEVKISLDPDDSQLVASLTNLQVEVTIHL